MSDQQSKLDKLKLNKETIADLDVNSPDAVKGGAVNNEGTTGDPRTCDAKSKIGCPTDSIYCIKAR
jgi:hypothetical protein